MPALSVIDILKECVSAQPSPDRLRALAAGGPDWAAVRKAAARHGVVSLLHRVLDRCGGVELLPHVHWMGISTAAAMRSNNGIRLADALVRTTARLTAGGIESLAYKGPALGTVLYGRPEVREFQDLDLIIRRRDVPAARRLLEADGFVTPQLPAGVPSSVLIESDFHNELTMALPGRGETVDLHWSLTEGYFRCRLDTAPMFARAEAVRMPQGTVAGLPREEMLCALALHGTRHCWERLMWICDVAHLIGATPTMDWDRVAGIARRAGLSRILNLTLLLAADPGGAEIPSDMMRKARAEFAARRLADEVRGNLSIVTTGSASAPQDAANRWRTSLFHCRSRESPTDRLRYAIGLMLSPSEWDWQAAPGSGSLRPWHYLLRPMRLLAGRFATGRSTHQAR